MIVEFIGSADIIWAATWENRIFAYAKTKTQISFAVTAKLISAFVFATWIVQSLSFLNPKFQVPSHLLWLRSPVCVGTWSETPKTGFLTSRLILLYVYQCWVMLHIILQLLSKPRREKTGLRGFRPGPTQTGLRNYSMRLETWNFRFRKYMGCTLRVAKTKTLISFAVTAKLICVFVFAYAKIRFSHVAAQVISTPSNHSFVLSDL